MTEDSLNNNIDDIDLDIDGDNNEEKKNYSWNNEGKTLLNSNKKYLTDEDLTTIRYCFQDPLPDDLREEYWLLVTGAKESKLNNPNYYNTLLNKYPVNPISIRNENQILLDIYRTFPEDEDFKEEKINSLKNVLIAYSRRNCTLGYCQGFNYIVGKILKVITNEENVFWIFTQIIENILPINYYCDSIGIIIDNNILFDTLKDLDKELMAHFTKYQFELLIKNILYKWLICLFSQNIKDELLFLIWDIFFIEGTPTLFKTIIIILEKNKEKLLQITQIDKLVDLFDTVRSLSLLNQHKDELLKDLLKYNKKINNMLVVKGRKKWYKKVKESMKGIKTRFLPKQIKNCCEDWDNCSYIKRKYDGEDFIVFKKNENIDVIEDFYQKKIRRNNSKKVKSNKKLFDKKMNEFYEYDDSIVQRRIHECPNGNKKRIKDKMKSCINLNENNIKNILEGSYIYNNNITKNIKENKTNYNNKNKINEISNDEDDDSFNEYLYLYNL